MMGWADLALDEYLDWDSPSCCAAFCIVSMVARVVFSGDETREVTTDVTRRRGEMA